ncbi:hypothetical protein GGR26_003119 [Lewinella marina]|uniref:DUF3299 domain-containing protein n=1 Tax=Neolewinella marina TaxID=438751 RepID=A0A2G0CEE2_9BACT|nr:hypothetical protein [Neolewinella marina]NJB87339.1 hypothetical protein [Neolewinella marina]PHK98344.1 hypothetical protein CGL56_11630 [Neolewinella marina]
MRFLVLLCFLAFSAVAVGQSAAAAVWDDLSKVTYEKKYDELLGFKVDVPVFGKDVKALEGKVIEISGYIVPVEGYKSHNEFVFSAYPYNMCFFCGGAGPETVMEVQAKEPVKYRTERITLRGKLRLNNDNINQLMYLLEDAEQVLTK